eukprot:TRINITY_DN16087_c0_g1_i1.p1 TRINITY_DN16087_c0_g1~~TRINITY_DN16087_c0_g1_i1.p1  ORF type:complete len:116 (+),score=24.93 TRINITY_DN16087_c0_g1_i1:31-348(+)
MEATPDRQRPVRQTRPPQRLVDEIYATASKRAKLADSIPEAPPAPRDLELQPPTSSKLDFVRDGINDTLEEDAKPKSSPSSSGSKKKGGRKVKVPVDGGVKKPHR